MKPTIAETFDEHYIVDPVTGCHVWQRAKVRGYGQLLVDGKLVFAHRYSWFRKHGRWPTPCALHRCDNPPCVNEEHLFEGTHKRNMEDAIIKGRFVAAVSRIGEAHANAKLAEEDVRAMRKGFAAGESTGALARRFSICQSRAWKICKGKAWKHVAA